MSFVGFWFWNHCFFSSGFILLSDYLLEWLFIRRLFRFRPNNKHVFRFYLYFFINFEVCKSINQPIQFRFRFSSIQFNSVRFGSTIQVNSMQSFRLALIYTYIYLYISVYGYWVFGIVGQLLLLSARTYPFRFWLLWAWAADSFVGPDRVVRRRRLGS